MDEFFRALGVQFSKQRGNEGRAAIVIAATFAALLVVWLVAVLLRRRHEQRALLAFAAQHGIGAEELKYAAGLAAVEEQAPLALLEQVDLFELATAKALLGLGAEAQAPLIGKLRHALGFDQLAKYIPLYSSRELPVGTALQLGATPARVVQNDELHMVVQIAAFAAVEPGVVLPIEVPLARDAPYRLHCTLLSLLGAGPVRLTVAHDESPLHLSQVEPRIPLRGTIALRSALIGDLKHEGRTSRERPLPDSDRAAQLLEASTHELLVSSLEKLPLGHQFDVSFKLGTQAFAHLRALVCDGPERGGQAQVARLVFKGLSMRERERLRAAILANK